MCRQNVRCVRSTISCKTRLTSNYSRVPHSEFLSKRSKVFTITSPASSSNNFDVALSRNYTRLASLWATFAQRASGRRYENVVQNVLCPNDDATREKLSYFLQMGTRRIPDMDSVGVKEAWWRLMDCVGIGGSLAHRNGITNGGLLMAGTVLRLPSTQKK